MQDNPCLNDKLQRHRDFWARRPTDRPLIGICRPLGKTAPGFELLGDRPLAPEDVNESLYQAYRHCYTVCTPCADRPGDLFYTTIPHCGVPWYEVLMGCAIHFSDGTLMAWAEHLADKPEQLRQRWRLPLTTDDPWLDRLRFALRRKQEDFPGVPVPTVLGRGVLDLLLAAMPNEEVLAGLMTEPERYLDILTELTDMIILAIAEQLKVLQPFHGGYANRRGLWAPGTACWSQEDGASLVGPRLYRDLILPHDRRIWASVEYAMIHTHSVGLPVMIESLLDAPELKCVECTVDAGGPTLDELLPLWRRVLEGGKSLLVCLEEATPEVERVIAELPAVGLAVSVSTDNPQEYDHLMA